MAALCIHIRWLAHLDFCRRRHDGNLARDFTGGRESRKLTYVQNGSTMQQSCSGVGVICR